MAEASLYERLARTLDVFDVRRPEKEQVLSAFAAHKGEVIAGSLAGTLRGAVTNGRRPAA